MSRYQQIPAGNAKANKPAADVNAFLLAAGHGKSIRRYQKDQEIFIQGQKAQEVFYLQQGRVHEGGGVDDSTNVSGNHPDNFANSHKLGKGRFAVVGIRPLNALVEILDALLAVGPRCA